MRDVVLYHATDSGNKLSIHKNGFKIPKADMAIFYAKPMRKKPGTLGFGLYGFLDDENLAKQFFTNNFHSKNMTVYKLFASINDEYLLDFSCNTVDMKMFYRFLSNPKLRRTIDNLSKFYRNGRYQRSLDGALIEMYINRTVRKGDYPEIDAVCGSTVTNMNDFNFPVSIPNGIEYCIRDKKIISNVE